MRIVLWLQLGIAAPRWFSTVHSRIRYGAGGFAGFIQSTGSASAFFAFFHMAKKSPRRIGEDEADNQNINHGYAPRFYEIKDRLRQTQQTPTLINDQGNKICEHNGVADRKYGPAPGGGFLADHAYRGQTRRIQ